MSAQAARRMAGVGEMATVLPGPVPTQAPTETPVLIVGAGPAGLAVAACLTRAGTPHVVLEQGRSVGVSWRGHYERLHLHTEKAYSSLPYVELPDSYPRYPSRRQVVDYLEAYARHFGIVPRFGQRVVQARRAAAGWEVQTEDHRWRARALVVAGGWNRVPLRPTWPGIDRYQGALLHSADYRNGGPLRGQRVLVVGLGNSGGEIAIDLWEHGAKPTLAVRSPVNVIPREVLGMSFISVAIQQRWMPARLADALNAPVTRLVVGDLRRWGLQRPAQGPVAQVRESGRIPFIDIGTIGLIKKGEVAVRPGIERFTPGGVVFTDGRAEDFNAVVLATGYRPGLQWLQTERPVLDEQGAPLASGRPCAEPGLYFCGYYISPTGMLREIAQEARQLAGELARVAAAT